MATPVAVIGAHDELTHDLIVITQAHHEVHEGHSFSIHEVQNLDTTTAYWMITAPDTAIRCHVIFDIVCTGEFRVTVTEGADRTGTTPLTADNRDRNSSNTATLVMHRGYSGGTTDGAVPIVDKRDGATGVGGKVVAIGGQRGDNEFILKQGTKYIIEVTTFSDVWVSGQLDWYEV